MIWRFNFGGGRFVATETDKLSQFQSRCAKILFANPWGAMTLVANACVVGGNVWRTGIDATRIPASCQLSRLRIAPKSKGAGHPRFYENPSSMPSIKSHISSIHLDEYLESHLLKEPLSSPVIASKLGFGARLSLAFSEAS